MAGYEQHYEQPYEKPYEQQPPHPSPLTPSYSPRRAVAREPAQVDPLPAEPRLSIEPPAVVSRVHVPQTGAGEWLALRGPACWDPAVNSVEGARMQAPCKFSQPKPVGVGIGDRRVSRADNRTGSAGVGRSLMGFTHAPWASLFCSCACAICACSQLRHRPTALAPITVNRAGPWSVIVLA